jgi:hypothetical protein
LKDQAVLRVAWDNGWATVATDEHMRKVVEPKVSFLLVGAMAAAAVFEKKRPDLGLDQLQLFWLQLFWSESGLTEGQGSEDFGARHRDDSDMENESTQTSNVEYLHRDERDSGVERTEWQRTCPTCVLYSSLQRL